MKLNGLSAEAAPLTSKVKLEFSSTGQSGPWSLIHDSLPNNGRYQWQVPSGVNSSNCFIRYTVFEGGNSATGMNTAPFIVGSLIGIQPVSNEIPHNYALFQNYPNPFNPTTNFGFRIADFGFVQMKIFNVQGKKIETLINENLLPGEYELTFDGSNLPSGIYYYVLTTGNYSQTKKMVLVK